MNVYRNGEGRWVGTQALAGNKEVIDIPTTSKSALLEWLNENVPANSGEVPPITNSPDNSRDVSGQCPRCKLTWPAAMRIAQGMQVEAYVKVIDSFDDWQVARLMEAVIDKCRTWKDKICGKD